MKNFLIILLFSFVFISCKDEQKSKNLSDLDKTSLVLDWTMNMSFVGDLIAINEKASDNGIEVQMDLGGSGINPITLVNNGTYDFGIASFEQLLKGNEKGTDLVAIGIINNVNPTVFISLGANALNAPKDMNGKRVGINPGGATENVYRIFKKEMGLVDIVEIPTDFGIVPFINKIYDIRLAFEYIEPIDLELNNLPYSILRPEDYGLKLPGRVYFTRSELIKDNPVLIQKFINTVAMGWEEALENKDKAMNYLTLFDKGINIDRESKSYDLGMKYYKGYLNNVLSFDNENLIKSANQLKQLKQINNSNIVDALDSSFIDRFHSINEE